MNTREVHVGRWEQHVQRAGGSRTRWGRDIVRETHSPI